MRNIVLTTAFLLVFGVRGYNQNTLYFQQQDFVLKTNNKIAVLTPQEQKEQGVLLSSKIIIEYQEDKNTGEIHEYYGIMKRYHINEAGAIDSYNKVYLPVSNQSDLVLLSVRSISKTGVVKELGQEAIKETQVEGNTYKMVAVEGVEQGGEIEFFYVIKIPTSTFGSEVMHNEIPIRSAEFRLISPEYLTFDAKLYNQNSVKIDTIITGKKHLGFIIKDLNQLYEEKYATIEANSARVEFKLLYNTVKGANTNKVFSWQDAGNRFFEIMQESNKESTKEIEKVIKKQNLSALNEVQAIQQIENYIKINIAIKEDATDALPAEVLKSKFADDGSMSRLYVQFFEALGINYELIIGINRYKKRLDKTFDTWGFLDKYFFYFPDQKKYLDPNNPLVRFGQMNVLLEGSDALFVSNIKVGNIKTAMSIVKHIPFSNADENFDNIEAQVGFPDDMSTVNIKMKRIFGGHQAGELKGYFMLSNDEERKNIMDNVLKSALKEDATFTNSKATNYDYNTEEGTTKYFEIYTDASAKSMIEKAGNKYFFKLGDIIGPQVEMYNERPRQQPIDVGNAHKYERKITVNIPKGFKVRGLDSINRNLVFSLEGKNAMGFVSDYKLDGEVLTINISEYYNYVELPITTYDNFQKVINAAADFNKVTLVLER